MKKQYTKQFKEDAVKYYLDHKDLGLSACAANLGTSKTALSLWAKEAKELRDTKDALDILKKAISILGS